VDFANKYIVSSTYEVKMSNVFE
jgi:poly(ADP-ribose) glycohydrolase